MPSVRRDSDAEQFVIFDLKRIEASKSSLKPSDVLGNSKIYVDQVSGLVPRRRILKVIVPVKLRADLSALRQNGAVTKVIAAVGAKSQILFPMVNPCVVASQALYRPIGMIVPKPRAIVSPSAMGKAPESRDGRAFPK